MSKMTMDIVNRFNQRGSAAVEFALLIVLLLMIVAGVVEFGRTIWYYDALSKATRDSARYLSNIREDESVAINNLRVADAVSMVEFAANEADIPDFRREYVSVSCDVECDAAAPNYVAVRVSYPIIIGKWIPFLVSANTTKTWSVNLSPETTMRYMR
jgi:Flp pilus assembly protein TadG